MVATALIREATDRERLRLAQLAAGANCLTIPTCCNGSKRRGAVISAA